MTDQPPSKELTEAIAMAHRQLDEPFADPDDDIRTVARQFLRSRETIESLQTALRGIQSCSTCEACRGAATRALGGEPAADVLSQIDDLLQTMIVSAEVFTDTDGTVTGYKIKTGALHKIVGLRTHLFFPQNMKEAERPAQPPGAGQ